MPRMRKKLLGAAVASATVISAIAMTSTANAEEGRTARSLDQLKDLRAGTAADGGRFGASSAGGYRTLGDACLSDPAGDTQLFDGTTATPSDEPRADITTVCAMYSDGFVTLGMELVGPTDPSTDAGWTGDTGLLWVLDVDGDEVEDYVAGLFEGAAGGVSDVATGEVVCDAVGDYDTSGVYVLQFDEACLGTPASYRVLGFSSYDADPAVGGPTHVDETAFSTSVTRSAPTEPPPSGGAVQVSRLAGADRYETAVTISRFEFPGGSARVFLARADGYADALAGGALTSGPILLVPQCGTLPAVVREELVRLQPDHVTALGGPGAVCDAMLQQAADSVV